jgi:hypothetical protein
MKSHQTLVLLIFGVSLAACKKESPIQSMSNASPQQNAVTTGCKTCPDIDPSHFVKKIDNRFLPWIPGTSYAYVLKEWEDGKVKIQHQYVTVTNDTKIIEGVAATVVHDVVKENGKVVEDTYDWYAQDKKGNVWYLGEATRARTDTGWSTEGSWEAGVHGACAGIVMYADFAAHLGESYRQEYLKGVAEDAAKNLDANVTVKIKYGTFYHCVKTAEFSRLEPGIIEHKYYAPGIGNILVVGAKGVREREELVRYNP